jgi:hypothetical protein
LHVYTSNTTAAIDSQHTPARSITRQVAESHQ